MDNHPKSNNNSSLSNSSVNPWQNSSIPAVSSLQLTDTQAQLALAITNLLRPRIAQQSLLFDFNNRTGKFSNVQHSYGKLNRSNTKRNHTKINKFKGTDISRQNVSHKKEQRKSSSTLHDTTTPELSISKNSNVSGSKNTNDETTKGNSGSDKENESQEGDEFKQKQLSTNNIKESASNKEMNKNKYAGIPTEYLKCSCCNKKMWDGESFEKHLRGHAHRQIFESLEESFNIQADMMRQNNQLNEKRKVIELNRMKRLGKHIELDKGVHCNMCDYYFSGRETAHRKSDGHQQLKLFLHPPCKLCNLEFATRIEWEEHRLTPEHLRKLMFSQKNYDNVSFEDGSSDNEKILNITTIESENGVIKSNENENLNNLENFPLTLDENNKIASNMISKVTAYICKICNRLLLTKESSDKHAKSKIHFDNYVKYVQKERYKLKQTKKIEEKKELARESSQLSNNEEEGNCKRRKLSKNENIPQENKITTEQCTDEILNINCTDTEKETSDIKYKSLDNDFWEEVDKDIDLILNDITPIDNPKIEKKIDVNSDKIK